MQAGPIGQLAVMLLAIRISIKAQAQELINAVESDDHDGTALGVKLPGEKAEKSTAAPNAKDTKAAAKDRGERRGHPGRHSVKQPNPAY